MAAFVLSFPKCGRTWLRVMLARALELHFRLPQRDFLVSNTLLLPDPRLPVVKLTHDDKPHQKAPHELSTDKTKYRDSKVILLIRDLRDAMVSHYFQETRRRKRYNADLSAFLRHDRGSADSFIRFYNIWVSNRHVPADFLLVRYEDMHARAETELRRVLDFLGFHAISDAVIRDAVAYASFDNMRKLEASESLRESRKLRPADKRDSESYKTRKGRVGGFRDYLGEEDIWYLNEKLTQLSAFYGYGCSP